jgi:hypothetical protein
MVEIIEQRHEREIVIARKWRTSRQADTYRKGLTALVWLKESLWYGTQLMSILEQY